MVVILAWELNVFENQSKALHSFVEASFRMDSLSRINRQVYLYGVLIFVNLHLFIFVYLMRLRLFIFSILIYMGILLTVNITLISLFNSYVEGVYFALNLIIAMLLGSVWIYRIKDEQIKELLNIISKYLHINIYKQIEKNPNLLKLGGKKKVVTVFFADLRGFTTLSEELAPDVVVRLLKGWFNFAGNIIYRNKGVIDKFIGDCVMAFWNSPIADKRHACNACYSALALKTQLSKYDPSKRLRVGIGINTGEVIVGNIGSSERFDYTIIGDTVNIASRLESLTKKYGVHIIITEATVNELKKEGGDKIFGYRKLDKVILKGKTNPTYLYELMGGIKEVTQDFVKLYEDALELYISGLFDDARDKFIDVLNIYEDNSTKLLLERLDNMSDVEKQNWLGYFVLDSKF